MHDDPFATAWTMPPPGQWTEEQKREWWKPKHHDLRLMLSTFCDLCILLKP